MTWLFLTASNCRTELPPVSSWPKEALAPSDPPSDDDGQGPRSSTSKPAPAGPGFLVSQAKYLDANRGRLETLNIFRHSGNRGGQKHAHLSPEARLKMEKHRGKEKDRRDRMKDTTDRKRVSVPGCQTQPTGKPLAREIVEKKAADYIEDVQDALIRHQVKSDPIDYDRFIGHVSEEFRDLALKSPRSSSSST